ncbi:MAG: type II toxin-antitoxin system HicB family antitoxin [Candidatus Ornithomonoglobus sp.]
MKNMLEYKDYYGTVEYSSEDNVLYGKVIGINGLVSYEGTSVDELRADFEEAVDDYIDMCREKNIEPQRLYRGSFNVRISPALHKSLAMYAAAHNQTMNTTVEEAIRNYVL